MSSQDRRVFIILAVVLSIFSGYLIWDHVNRSVLGGVDSGNKAADFTVQGVNNSSFTLSDHLGEVVIINFMATKCVSCQNQLDELEHILKVYDHIIIVSIEIDVALSWSDFVDYANLKNITWFIGHDANIGQKYKIFYIPTIIIVDQDGFIVYREFYSTYNTILDYLDQILST